MGALLHDLGKTKIDVIEALIPKVDHIIIGGGMAYIHNHGSLK